MKKSLWLLPLAVLLLFSIAGCSTRGNVYLSFDWITVPDDWSCTDPNIDVPGSVDTLNRLYEYPAETGDNVFTYTTGVNTWVYAYTLTPYQGSAFSAPMDAKFELYLWENVPPTFTQYKGLAEAGSIPPQATTGTPSPSATQTNTLLPVDRGAFPQEPTYEYTVTRGGYTLHVRGFLLKSGQ